jgi:hypothetical protein
MKKIKTINNIVMTKKIKTKKNRKYRKKNKSFKFGGATDVGPDTNSDTSPNLNTGDNSIDQLTETIKDEHSLANFLPNFNLGDSKILKKIIELSESLTMKTIDNTANYFNINLNDSDQFKQRLEELKMILNDPKNKQLMREVVANFAQVGIVALEASAPFMDKLITDIFDKLTIMGNEFGEAGVKIGLNTIEEIPGYGVIIGTIRSVSNAAEALIASSNTASEIWTVAADTTNASVQNFDKLLKEKGDLLNRTTDSINKFSENMKSVPNNVSGGSRKQKKNNNKSKKVRFNL